MQGVGSCILQSQQMNQMSNSRLLNGIQLGVCELNTHGKREARRPRKGARETNKPRTVHTRWQNNFLILLAPVLDK